MKYWDTSAPIAEQLAIICNRDNFLDHCLNNCIWNIFFNIIRKVKYLSHLNGPDFCLIGVITTLRDLHGVNIFQSDLKFSSPL